MSNQRLRESIFLLLLVLFPLNTVAQGQETAIPMPGMDTTIQLPESDGENGIQSNLKIRGYVENTLNYEQSKFQNRELLFNATRSRLNLSGKPGENFDFGIGVVGTLNSGATEFDLASYMPDELREQLAPEAAGLFRQRVENEIFLQEAFGTLYMPNFHLRIGKHKFYTGTGYAYNPIDIFNYKNPLDPTYEIDGLGSVLVTAELPRQTELQGFVKFGDRLSRNGYLLRLKTYVSGWDVALQYSENTKERVDWETLNSSEAVTALTQGDPFESFLRGFRWRLLGAEFAGELGGVGIHGEGGYTFIESKGDAGTFTNAGEDHERFLIGIDHTFDFQLYFIAEYLRIGQGKTDSSEIALNDRMAYLSGEILSTNRDTVFTGFTYPLTDLMDFSLYGILACNDPSVIVNPWLLYSIYPGVNLYITAYVPVGDEQSQNGKSGPGGFVRLKFNF
ncbi:hypothetical protein ACFL6S_34080 [Candidatus Poribacteria bacterium]